MSEMARTGLFVGAAVVMLLAAFVVGPGTQTYDVQELVGDRLNQFDIDAPKRLKIVRYDTESSSAREFEVAEEGGLWTIPSKQGYPADAARQMAEAATSVMDREILRIAATTANEHEDLGVVNPSSSNLDGRSDGVGTRVVMSDLNNAVLTDMIIGKPVRDAEGQYYVRNANQDIVYVIAIDPSKLTTRFEDWIEDDLLKLSPFDIRRVNIKDYSADMFLTLQGPQVDWERRAEMELRYDNQAAEWVAESIRKFDPRREELVPYELADDEQLNEEALQALRNALDDLAIVDVERKPTGLSADLKAGEDFFNDNTAATSLMMRGFSPVAIGQERRREILSSEGEVVVTLRDGVEYVLRFGNLQIEGDEAPADAEDAAEGINRYLFVMAQFNESMIERPELDELPEIPARDESPAPSDSEEAEPQGAAPNDADEPASDEASNSEAADATSTNSESANDNTDESTADESGNDEAAPTNNDADPTDQQEFADTEIAKEDEAPQAETDEVAEEDDQVARIIAARKEIEQENQRRLDEYQERIEQGKQRVTELNERFGDWYYVISNDVYQKINLSLDKVVMKVDEEAAEDDTADEVEAPQFEAPTAETIELDSVDFDTLEAEGLEIETLEVETNAVEADNE